MPNSEPHLHIVAFAVPYPPNFGGVIDVYYKLKELKKAGIKVHLHCFTYQNFQANEALNELADTVFYYPRKGVFANLSSLPYIVNSRKSDLLLNRLAETNSPIIFEGLHSCAYLDHPALRDKVKIYRESNIEHHYYNNLANAEKTWWKKIYYRFEAFKLERFEYILNNAQAIFTVSEEDYNYLRKYPKPNHFYIPSFHPNKDIEIERVDPSKERFALYHGNLSVSENEEVANFLVEQLGNTDIKLVIAGLNPPQKLIKKVAFYPNIQLISNPDDAKMLALIKEAHLNLMLTFQQSGLKLKLLNVLFNGKFILANSEMLHGTGLEDCCEILEQKEQLLQVCKEILNKDLDIEKAKSIRLFQINERYNNHDNIYRILAAIRSSTPKKII